MPGLPMEYADTIAGINDGAALNVLCK
jgi:hypothetical protein